MRERKQGVQEAKERLTLDSFINLIIEGIKDYLGVLRKVFTVNHAKIDLLNPAVRCVYLGGGYYLTTTDYIKMYGISVVKKVCVKYERIRQ